MRLVHEGRLTRPTDISNELGTRPSNITSIVNALAKRGLVSRDRERDKGEDRRSVHISLTMAGEIAYREAGGLLVGASFE